MLLSYSSKNGSENSYGKTQEMVNKFLTVCPILENHSFMLFHALCCGYFGFFCEKAGILTAQVHTVFTAERNCGFAVDGQLSFVKEL